MFWSKNKASREKRDELIASMPVDENGDVREEYLRARDAARSKRSRTADARSTAKRVYPLRMPPEQAVSWVNNPGRSDVSGIDTDSPSNIERRTKKAPAKKTKGKAPAEPKAKEPTKPKAPEKPREKPKESSKPEKPKELARDSGTVFAGEEIVQIAKLADSFGVALPLSQDTMMLNDDAIQIALYQGDPTPTKSLFGLDLPETCYCIQDPRPLTKLDRRSSYKVTFDGIFVVFSKVADQSKKALRVPVDRRDYWRRFSDFQELLGTSHASRLDCQALSVAIRQMVDVGMSACAIKVENGELVVDASEWRCGIRAVIGACPHAEGCGAVFSPTLVKVLLDASGPVFDRILFGRNCPMVLGGTLGHYKIIASVRNEGAIRCSEERERAGTPRTVRPSAGSSTGTTSTA